MMVVLLILFCGAAMAQQPCWPLDMPTRYLTGNFMEPRDNSYHAGLDLKTNSQTGYHVLAVQDGHLSRVRMSVSGYGQALYLTAEDGTVYVYGHLGRLRDDLRALVQARQTKKSSYEMDLWFQPHEWPVKRGEVLALSGQSATLGPHLHFEVRGPDGQPRDPLAHGFKVVDTIAPEILAVRAVRRGGYDPHSLLMGDGKKPLKGRLPDLRLEQGPLYFSALIIERSDRQNHLLGPRLVRFLVNGRKVYETVNDHLRWDNRHHQRLEFVRTPLGQEQWLRLDDRNELAGRQSEAWLSNGRWPVGRHEVELITKDRAGNRSAVTWVLFIGEGPLTTEDAQPAVSGAWQPDIDVLNDPWLVDMDASELVTGSLPQSNLIWAAASLRESVPARFWRLTGLKEMGMPVQYRLDDDWALMQTVAVAFHEAVLPTSKEAERVQAASDPTIGVYRLRSHAWSYAGPLRCGPDGLVYDLRQPGVYQVMRDESPPFIATAGVVTKLYKQPPGIRGGVTMPSWPVLNIPVGDHGSGVDWTSVSVSLNGQPFIVEPDPPRQRILVELPETIEPGSHLLEVALRDRAGHGAQSELVLTLLDPTAEEVFESLESDGVAAPSP